MRTRRVRGHEEEEDATEQAGWLFADSFLALMIIFLATISFVPDIKNVEDTAKTYTQALTLTYDKYDPVQVEADIVKFLTKADFPLSSKVVFARIIGGAPATCQRPQSLGTGAHAALRRQTKRHTADLGRHSSLSQA